MATMGLIRNSGAVVIAAMLVAPLMTPILGVAASIMMGRTHRTLKTVGAIAVAVVWSVVLSWAMMFLANNPDSQMPQTFAVNLVGKQRVRAWLRGGAGSTLVGV